MFNSYVETTLEHDPALCDNCGLCIAVCPHAVFARAGRTVRAVRPEACIECGACERNCPAGAIKVESGVGCAAAMIGAALRGQKEVTCGGCSCGSSSEANAPAGFVPLSLVSFRQSGGPNPPNPLTQTKAIGVTKMTQETGEQIREAVREHYAAAARQVQVLQPASCCSSASTSCCSTSDSTDAQKLYEISQISELPETAVLASLGCGNPTLLAELKPGEVVLDLGSGGGIDVLLSAKRVGSTGRAYGLDMTDEMLELARGNAAKAGVSNVEFLKGQIEAIPLPDASVDVIISNCVINLSADKDAVLREAHRVLKPGGRFAVADIVVRGGPLPPALRQLMNLWAGCVSGALTETEYREKLAKAGFGDVEVVVLKTHGLEDVPENLRALVPADAAGGETQIISAFVRARKAGAGKAQGGCCD